MRRLLAALLACSVLSGCGYTVSSSQEIETSVCTLKVEGYTLHAAAVLKVFKTDESFAGSM